MKNYRFWLMLFIVTVIGGLVFDSVAAFKPSMPPLREGNPEPARPTQADTPFSKIPIAPTFAERQQIGY